MLRYSICERVTAGRHQEVIVPHEDIAYGHKGWHCYFNYALDGGAQCHGAYERKQSSTPNVIPITHRMRPTRSSAMLIDGKSITREISGTQELP
jgi:hypothetical protein